MPVSEGKKLEWEEIRRLISSPPEPAQVIEMDDAPVAHLFSSVKAIRIFSSLVALAAVAVSIYYSYQWFIGRQPVVLAMVMAAIIVSCSTLFPNVAILFAKRGGPSVAGAIFIFAMALVCAFFSMGTTVGGLYDARSRVIASFSEDASIAKKYAVDSALLEGKRSRANEAAARLRKDEAGYQVNVERVLAMETVDERALRSFETRRDAARKGADAKERELAAIEAEIRSLQSSSAAAVIVRDDFFSWIAKRLSSTPDTVEFLMSAFPAVFIDILAPIMLAIVLFLKEEK